MADVTTAISKMAERSILYFDRLDAVSHNIANIETTGFKAEHFYPAIYSEKAAATGNTRTLSEALGKTDYSQGMIEKTGNVFDLAINGEGFFAIETPEGAAYTRDGRFTLNSNNELVTQRGDYVMGTSGRITVSAEDPQSIVVDAGGAVIADGSEVARVSVSAFGNPDALTKGSSGLLYDTNETAGKRPAEDYVVQSGFLERSNVEAIREMVNMINLQRSLESYQKTIQTIGEQDKLSTNRLGRLG